MGNTAKGQRLAKPDSPLSVSREKNGVTTAIFVKLEPDERRMLDAIAIEEGLPCGVVLRALIVECSLRRAGEWSDARCPATATGRRKGIARKHRHTLPMVVRKRGKTPKAEVGRDGG